VRSFLAVGIGSGSVADAREVVRHETYRTVTIDAEYLKVAAGIAAGRGAGKCVGPDIDEPRHSSGLAAKSAG